MEPSRGPLRFLFFVLFIRLEIYRGKRVTYRPRRSVRNEQVLYRTLGPGQRVKYRYLVVLELDRALIMPIPSVQRESRLFGDVRNLSDF